MTVIIDGGAGITFPDTVQQTNGMTMTGGNPKYYAVRAWVNFNGTGTIAIRTSANVSSLTDNGIGDYTINFTTAMPDASFSVAGLATSPGGGGDYYMGLISNSAASTRVSVFKAGTGAGDGSIVCVSVFR